MLPILSIAALSKHYTSGLKALDGVDLSIERGEIFALLGPNGAGKTTLISIVCGTVTMTSGTIAFDGHDITQNLRAARQRIGLVPQEVAVDIFATVWDTVRFSRGLFGRPPDPAYIERILRDLSIWDKRDSRIIELSGGMKRRVMIAKALGHEPDLLFLDEPTAGVDVELRREMWAMIAKLRDEGVTIILTTHYIEEAEEMADRIGIIDKGELILVEDKQALMDKLGRTEAAFTLKAALDKLPADLADWPITLSDDGLVLTYMINTQEAQERGLAALVRKIDDLRIDYRALDSHRSSLEDIFVDLVEKRT